VSNPKLKPLRPTPVGTVTGRKRYPTGMFIRWGLAAPKPGESVRWESIDGRWVSISLGHGASVGKAIVADSSGKSEAIETYEDALALAKLWRT
jgi:hypothetical protein